MVTEEEKLEIPVGYDVREIEPGYHENDELEFTDEEMYYVLKPDCTKFRASTCPRTAFCGWNAARI